ncbi:class I SAM-dependent methyltransferase [Aquabacterium sp.]|uniref:class I SAM-dependent methyltransferase n=1 Tax=Aquabacterium sp. TaxID=1872578 RepID=UPI002CE65C63|nr:methyltransferase domain-containing protein [Aquabacterium sp.]HSW07686.1 methyltransferase domain-containing protein [Aquabacterium sp.]
MTRESSIIELAQWLKSPPGRYLLSWEQAQFDRDVADLFGFHALQLGVSELDGLRANRMPHRWLASDSLFLPDPLDLPPVDESISTLAPHGGLALHCEFDALPFPSTSLDLVVLPHALELARDAHDTLREVERVLVPEGRIVITGFNPTSLWGLRQGATRMRQRMGLGGGPYLPQAGEFIGYWRVRDWLRLLGFEVELGRFGCWRPPFRTQRWLERGPWIEAAGERWWPVLGAVYCLVAVKRVRGMRLVGLTRRQTSNNKASAPAVVANMDMDARGQE